jgi:hypothetical protein
MTAKDGVETTIAGKHGPADVHQLSLNGRELLCR